MSPHVSQQLQQDVSLRGRGIPRTAESLRHHLLQERTNISHKIARQRKGVGLKGGGLLPPPRLLSLGTWGGGRRRDGTPCVSLPCHVWIFHYWDPKPLSSSSPLFSICVLERKPIMVWNHPPPLPLIDYTSLSKPFRCFLPNILCLLILIYLIPTVYAYCLQMKYLYLVCVSNNSSLYLPNILCLLLMYLIPICLPMKYLYLVCVSNNSSLYCTFVLTTI